MKCLTLHQPWATLVAIGAKKIETRSWYTQYRGPLAIAAAKKLPPDAPYYCYGKHFDDALIEGFCMPNNIVPSKMVERLPLGSILCIADLYHVEPITPENAPPEPERSFGNYDLSDGPRFAWHLRNVVVLPEPIPCRGLQRLWTPPPDVLERLQRTWKEDAA